MNDNEKKTINLRLYTAVVLITIFILVVIYMIMFAINKHNAQNKIAPSMEYIPSTTDITNIEVKKEKKNSDKISAVTSLDDEVTTNSTWCGTFQLVWNDMINNVVKQNVKFLNGDNLEIAQKIADNLDKQTFKEDQLSEKDYYKVFDNMSLELKSRIEKAIKNKFNETSDILGDIDWYDDPDTWVFYTMLKKVFNFENDFDELENSTFANKYDDIKYFGINENSDSKLYSQVKVLYYNDINDFAVILKTKEGEDVILARGLKGNTFLTEYNDLVKKSNEYKGNKDFTENDTLKVPNIKLSVEENYDILCNKNFYGADKFTYHIEKAIQTIQLDMDKSGGKIKSEAVIVLTKNSMPAVESKTEKRYFNLNDEFTMFLKESEKEMPYFAANIQDITLFQ